MANGTTQRTRNLRLFLSSGLTAEARANLEIIDRLADNTFIESTETVTFRAKTNMVFQPASDDLNGTPGTGTMSFGTVNNKAATMEFYPVSVAVFHAPIKIKDILTITTADTLPSTLTVNTGGQARTLSLGGSLITSVPIILQSSSSVTATLVAGTQTLVNTDSPQTLSNKTIDLSNSINLTGKITNTDVAAGAAISYSKLNLANSIRATDFTNIPGEQLSYSQVNLEDQLRSSDWSSNPAHKLSSTKIETDFHNQEIITSGGLSVRNVSDKKTTIRAATNIPNNLELVLPSAPGTVGQALAMLPPSPGNPYQIQLGWVSTGTTLLQTGEIYVGSAGTPTPTNPGVLNASDIIASVNEGLVLKPSGVSAGTYGSATQVAQIEVDAKGRALTVTEVAIDHDAITNFVADEHVAHSTVSITPSANGGLSGGGNITASRTLTVDPTNAAAKALPVSADTILLADSADANTLKKTTLGALSSAIGVQSHKANWVETDPSPFVITHNLNSTDTIVQIIDTANGETIGIDNVTRAANTVTLTAQNKPASFTWRVLILKV